MWHENETLSSLRLNNAIWLVEIMTPYANYKIHTAFTWTRSGNGELSDPLCDSVNRGSDFSQIMVDLSRSRDASSLSPTCFSPQVATVSNSFVAPGHIIVLFCLWIWLKYCRYSVKHQLKSLSQFDRELHGHGKKDGFVLDEYIMKQCSSCWKYTNISVMKKQPKKTCQQ